MDELLAQALELVSEDRRGQLADIIEEMVEAAQTAPPKVHVLAVRPGTSVYDIIGVYASAEALRDHAKQLGVEHYSRGEYIVKGVPHAPQV